MTVETPNGGVSIVAPPTTRDGEAPSFGPVPRIGEHSEKIKLEFSQSN